MEEGTSENKFNKRDSNVPINKMYDRKKDISHYN